MTRKKKTQKKELPNGVSEQEFLTVLDNISKRLAHKFKFGYHDFDDMKQQAAIFAMEGLEKYDNSRPLENFLWTHVRNRLFNYKRNNYQRPDKPCLSCPLYDKLYQKSNNQCAKFLNKDDCEPYSNWTQRNSTKKNIMLPQNIEQSPESIKNQHHANDPSNIHENKELVQFFDQHITKPEYRETYLKLKNGAKVNKPDVDKLKEYISTLMKEHSWNPPRSHENEDS
jgi:DNA-directed RNA polymerase specialized sigma subunit